MEKKILRRLLVYCSFVAFLFGIIAVNNKVTAKGAYGTIISYSTDKSTITDGATFNIYVNIRDVSNLYGASMDFKFDPNLLKILDITEGSVFNGQRLNRGILADNRGNGEISFYTTLRGNAKGISSSNAALFVIRVQALKTGSMIINTVSDNSSLSNPGNNIRIKLSDASASSRPIPYTAFGYNLYIGPSDTARYFGLDRYKTSVAISQAGWTQSDYIVVATGQDYPDALCATPLAGKYDAPILLTPQADLNADIEREIDRLKPTKAFIVGGTGVVSSTVEYRLKSKGIAVTRLAGINRFETSAIVAKELSSSTTAFLVTARNYPDALSIASYAAYLKAPILLTDKNNLDSSISKVVSNGTIKNTYVIGGPAIISDSLMNTLPTPKRIYGANRYETNLAILNSFDFNYGSTYIATGEQFADALSGSALAGRYKSPIILVSNTLPSNLITRFREIRNVAVKKFILGGTGAVSDSIIEKIFN